MNHDLYAVTRSLCVRDGRALKLSFIKDPGYDGNRSIDGVTEHQLRQYIEMV